MSSLLKIILCAPSGAGKTTLKNKLLKGLSSFTFSVSHTTRAARPTERDGKDYHFVDRARFEAMRAEGRFLEWAEVHGNLYGTARSELERAEDRFGGVLFDVDYQGARQIKAAVPDTIGIFILPGSYAELRGRLVGRGTESEESVARRLAMARTEIEAYPYFDYLVLNDEVESASAKLRSILTAEACKRTHMAPIAESILRTWE